MSRRAGVTLMEVLVAIFIMGIGMLAMLVLFPLGVLRMAQSLQDETCALVSRMATSIATFQGVRNDPAMLYDPYAPGLVVSINNPGAGYTTPPTVTFSAPSWPTGTAATGTAVLYPPGPNAGQVLGVNITSYGTGYVKGVPITVTFAGGGGVGAVGTVTQVDSFINPGFFGMLVPDAQGPSYPVFVDPMGYFSAQGSSNQCWVAGLSGNANTIPRRTAQYAMSQPYNPLTSKPDSGLTMRWTCHLDAPPFNNVSGLQYDLPPIPPNPGTFTRDIRYSFAYMLKRPRSSDRSVVDMSVVVYNSNRPILSSAFNEYLYQSQAGGLNEVDFDPVGNSITIDVTASGNVVPPARPGDWLLDASYVPNQAGTFATINGNFYRVVGVSQNTDTSYTFQVGQILRNMPATTAINPATNAPFAWQKVIFMDGVAEVFEKGPGRLP